LGTDLMQAFVKTLTDLRILHKQLILSPASNYENVKRIPCMMELTGFQSIVWVRKMNATTHDLSTDCCSV
jgi:hypothetical protein